MWSSGGYWCYTYLTWCGDILSLHCAGLSFSRQSSVAICRPVHGRMSCSTVVIMTVNCEVLLQCLLFSATAVVVTWISCMDFSMPVHALLWKNTKGIFPAQRIVSKDVHNEQTWEKSRDGLGESVSVHSLNYFLHYCVAYTDVADSYIVIMIMGFMYWTTRPCWTYGFLPR